MGYGVAGLAGLLIARMQRLALAFVMVGVVVGVIAFLGDYVLSDLVERSRPLTGNEASSYPSGHVFGGTLLFGFLPFLAFEHRSQPKTFNRCSCSVDTLGCRRGSFPYLRRRSLAQRRGCGIPVCRDSIDGPISRVPPLHRIWIWPRLFPYPAFPAC